MKREKDPCFLFYSQDWITGTYSMSNSQKGAFIDLLSLQHQGVIITLDVIKKTCDNKKDVEVILTKFLKNEDGTYYNEKIKKVMEERALYRFRQSQNASKRSATAKPPHQPNFSTHVENEDEIEEPITIESLDATRRYQTLDDLYED